jgi:uncharacterized protein (UPF0332 family)/predicted nucleotidyltransferase
MGKKSSKKEELPPEFANLPADVQEKLKTIKTKVDSFQKQIIDKFGKYIMGITLLPPKTVPSTDPSKPPEIPPEEKDKINVLVLIDDSDSTKMPKEELQTKLTTIIADTAKAIDEKMVVETVILSELWQDCYDGKYDRTGLISMGAPVHDTGMLQAIKIAEIHKSMVLKKFEKYILAYVLAGSLTQGKATPTSDIDVWIVIDDTDVKKMTRVELKDKLRAIIIGMGMEAGELTGIRNKLNIQVYILTDFWDSLKEANPVIFTLLRDGVPFYDRGIFMPWKQLLKMGKIKPSAEAIDIFLGSGEQVIRRVKQKLNEIGMEDIYYALLTPAQAAVMLYGMAPPTPKETPQVLMDIFVKKEKILEEKFVKILEHSVKIRKSIEHGELKELSGKEIDQLLDDGDKYLKRIKRLFTQIEHMRDQKDVEHLYDTLTLVMRDALVAEGREKVHDNELFKVFEEEIIATGLLPKQLMKAIKDIKKSKDEFEAKSLSTVDMEKFRTDSMQVIRQLIEYVQRKRARELERVKIRVKHQNKFGEVLVVGGEAFITFDIDAEQKDIQKSRLTKEGALGKLEKSSLEELEKALAEFKPTQRMLLKNALFESLRDMFGKDSEILLN